MLNLLMSQVIPGSDTLPLLYSRYIYVAVKVLVCF